MKLGLGNAVASPVADDRGPDATGARNERPAPSAGGWKGRHLWLLLLVLGVSVFLRTHEYRVWEENRALHFFENNPLLLNADGYYYLRLAREYRDGEYETVDTLRTTPEYPPRPSPPPLLSVLTVALSSLSSLSLEWTAALLPPLLSLCLLLPFLGLCRQFGLPPLASFVASLAALSSPQYLARSSMGFYDTDCLIVPFALGASVLALACGLRRDHWRYLCLLAVAFNAGLFAWWWDPAPEAVALICLVPLLIGAVLYYRPGRREGICAGSGLALLLLLAFLAVGAESVQTAIDRIQGTFVHGIPGADDRFPNVRDSISELARPGLRGLIGGTTGLFLTCLLGLAGLIWLAYAQPRRAAVALTVPVFLGLSAFFFGNRALIFWAPLIGIGIGALAALAGRYFERRGSGLVGFTTAVAALILAPALFTELHRVAPDPTTVNVIRAVPSIREETPEDAVIWTSWDAGYPIMYYTGRRTIADGQFMSGERQVYNSMPLASRDMNFARNFVRFYIEHGMAGPRRIHELTGSAETGLRWMRQLLNQSPGEAAADLLELSRATGRDTGLDSIEACQAFLFPDNREPVFLLLYHAMLQTTWFRYGSWDIVEESGESFALAPFHRVERKDDTFTLAPNLVFDVNEGLSMLDIKFNESKVGLPLRKIVAYDDTGRLLAVKDYEYPRGFHLEWLPHIRYGVVMTENVAESVFNQLFIRHQAEPAYFHRTVARNPAFSLWEVAVNLEPP